MTTVPVDDLIKQLSDSSWDVREKAAEALGKQGDKRAESALVQALSDNKVEVWRAAETSLGKLTSPEAARALAYEARAKKVTEPNAKLAVILPYVAKQSMMPSRDVMINTGAYSFQMPPVCVYCGGPVSRGESLRASLPTSSGGARITQPYFDAPCCSIHRIEVQRNNRIDRIVGLVALLISIGLGWYLIPKIFDDVSLAGQVIYGIIAVGVGGTILMGILRNVVANTLVLLSPTFKSLKDSPNVFDSGCLGLTIDAAGGGNLAFQFVNPKCGALFYAANRHSWIRV